MTHSNADDKTMCIIWPFYYAEERAKHFIGQLAGIDKAFLTWVGYRAPDDGRKVSLKCTDFLSRLQYKVGFPRNIYNLHRQ